MGLRKLLHICLTFIFLLNLFGCVTDNGAVIDKEGITGIAKKYALKLASVPITYRKIVDVHPTAVREDGNIKICVKLSCESDDCKEQHYLVSLPFNSFASGKTKPEKKDLQKDINSTDPYLPIYWFPVKKPSKECVEIEETNTPSESKIRIEKLYVQIDEWERLYDGLPKNKEDISAILKKCNKFIISNDTLYTINIVHEGLKSEKIFLTYCLDKYPDSGVHAIGIIGGYKDTSTKAGYALVPLANIADLALALILFVVVFFGGPASAL
ncbi:MAG: hypothetical protein SWH54_00925 [Thermodesulfobacteriota bacterium]|nr:hypothetical protein [Thermodesulfobacteriota bacterium]